MLSSMNCTICSHMFWRAISNNLDSVPHQYIVLLTAVQARTILLEFQIDSSWYEKAWKKLQVKEVLFNSDAVNSQKHKPLLTLRTIHLTCISSSSEVIHLKFLITPIFFSFLQDYLIELSRVDCSLHTSKFFHLDVPISLLLSRSIHTLYRLYVSVLSYHWVTLHIYQLSWIQSQSPTLPYRWPKLPDKRKFG